MKTALTALAILVLAALPGATPAAAVDSKGLFMMKGVGSQTCADFLRFDDPSRLVVETYLAGFVTAINIEREDTYDVIPSPQMGRAMEWLTAWCGENRDARVAVAVYELIEYYFPRRVRSAPAR